MRSATLLVLFSTVCVAQVPAKLADTDQSGLQGEWVASRVEAPPELKEGVKDAKKFRITVEGDKLVLSAGTGKEDSYTFKLDTSKNPRAIDLYDGDKLVSRSIYTLEKDKLQLCVGGCLSRIDVASKNREVVQVGDRPTAFDSRQGFLFMLVRGKGK